MKHLLNNLSEEEKQSILEQHNGGIKVFSENFKNLVEYKSGTVLNEQSQTGSTEQNLQEILTKVATEGIKNVTPEMIANPPFEGYWSAYVISGIFNNIQYSWDLSGVEGMIGIRGQQKGFITSEKNSTLGGSYREIVDASKSGVYVGFHSTVSNSGFICYLTDKNKPKIYRY